MAAYARCFSPATLRQTQPPVSPVHPPAPTCSYASGASCFRRGATPLTAAACQKTQPGRRSRRNLAVQSRKMSEEEQEMDEEEQWEDEAASTAEEVDREPLPLKGFAQNMQALREKGPPPGMSQREFEIQLARYERMMRDPKMRKQLEQARAMAEDPAVQGQMQEFAAVLQNKKLMDRMKQLQGPKVLARMRELEDDPDIRPFFDAVHKGGMTAMQKFMGNPEFLAMLSEKLGDIDMTLPGEQKRVPPGAGAAPGAAPGAPPPEEIENLLQAAKYGDLEAAEDLIAVGHDLNATDGEKRTPLHYAVAYRHMPVAEELLKGGADIEARDSKGNTPLHYAAGYGRGEFVERLLAAGADGTIRNDSDHTPFQLVSMEQRNPLNQEKDVFEKLQAAAGA